MPGPSVDAAKLVHLGEFETLFAEYKAEKEGLNYKLEEGRVSGSKVPSEEL